MTQIDGTTADHLTTQQALRLAGGRELVLNVLGDGKPRTLWEIQNAVSELGGVWFSESTISARIRDLRKPQWGGKTIKRRARHGHTFEYWMEG